MTDKELSSCTIEYTELHVLYVLHVLYLVRHKEAVVHVLGELGEVLPARAEQVAGADVHEAVLLDEELALSPLAAGGRTRDDDIADTTPGHSRLLYTYCDGRRR